MSYALKKCARLDCQNEAAQKYCSRACAPFAFMECEKPRGKSGGRGVRRFITHLGRTQTLQEWADELGLHKQSLWKRLRTIGVDRALQKRDLRASRVSRGKA